MTNQVNFKKVEVKGYTKQEAVAQAPFQVIRDATQAWKAAGKPITDKALKEFCAEYLTKHTKMAADRHIRYLLLLVNLQKQIIGNISGVKVQ